MRPCGEWSLTSSNLFSCRLNYSTSLLHTSFSTIPHCSDCVTPSQIVEVLGDKVGMTFRATVKREGDATLIATFITEEATAAF